MHNLKRNLRPGTCSREWDQALALGHLRARLDQTPSLEGGPAP